MHFFGMLAIRHQSVMLHTVACNVYGDGEGGGVTRRSHDRRPQQNVFVCV